MSINRPHPTAVHVFNYYVVIYHFSKHTLILGATSLIRNKSNMELYIIIITTVVALKAHKIPLRVLFKCIRQ